VSRTAGEWNQKARIVTKEILVHQDPPRGANAVTKIYLRITPDLKDEWVDSPENATKDYRKAAEATKKRLREKTTLVEIHDPRQMESKWVICKEEKYMEIDKKLAEEIVTALKHCLSGQGTGDFDLGQFGGNRLPTGRMASHVLRDLEATTDRK